MYIDLYRSALLHRHHKNTNLFIDSTSIFSSAPSGEMSSEFGILPTWLAYKSGVRDNLPVLCIMLPCITSHCRLALLMARRFFSWRTKNRKQIKYSFSPKYRPPFPEAVKSHCPACPIPSSFTYNFLYITELVLVLKTYEILAAAY